MNLPRSEYLQDKILSRVIVILLAFGLTPLLKLVFPDELPYEPDEILVLSIILGGITVAWLFVSWMNQPYIDEATAEDNPFYER